MSRSACSTSTRTAPPTTPLHQDVASASSAARSTCRSISTELLEPVGRSAAARDGWLRRARPGDRALPRRRGCRRTSTCGSRSRPTSSTSEGNQVCTPANGDVTGGPAPRATSSAFKFKTEPLTRLRAARRAIDTTGVRPDRRRRSSRPVRHLLDPRLGRTPSPMTQGGAAFSAFTVTLIDDRATSQITIRRRDRLRGDHDVHDHAPDRPSRTRSASRLPAPVTSPSPRRLSEDAMTTQANSSSRRSSAPPVSSPLTSSIPPIARAQSNDDRRDPGHRHRLEDRREARRRHRHRDLAGARADADRDHRRERLRTRSPTSRRATTSSRSTTPTSRSSAAASTSASTR